MKTTITIILSIITIFSYSQSYEWYDINFEDANQLFRLNIDTISNPNNIWQVGKPNKTIFTSAHSIPNAIVTDTTNPYPINDTSIFIIKHVASPIGGYICPHTAILVGSYRVNSDTINDYGKIEFSPNNGIDWINLLKDTANYYFLCYNWWMNRPVLSGNSNGWVNFYINLAQFGPIFNISIGDTVLYKFSFISDSIQSNKDGLIFDDFHFEDYCEKIEINSGIYLTNNFPNPAKDLINITFLNPNSSRYTLIIFGLNGQFIKQTNPFISNNITTDISDLVSGIYTYKLVNINGGIDYSGKFIKE